MYTSKSAYRDRARAAAAHIDPGGLIMIHGLPNGYGWLGRLHRLLDWTEGCIAVTDAEMDEIWQLVELVAPSSSVFIRRGSRDRLVSSRP